MADTQIDELRLDITVEDKTSGESSDKKVKNLATAISRLNKNLQAFDNAKFTKVFENMSKGLDPFVKKIESVSSALVSLATIVSKGGLDKAVKEVSGKVPELKTETTSDSGRKSEPIQAAQGQAEEISESIEDADDSLRDIDNRFDLLVAKGREIEKGLEKTKLTNKQILSLVSQRLTVEEGLNRLAQNEEKARIEAEAAQQQAEATEQAQKFRDTIVDVTSPLELAKIQLEKVQASLKENGLTENQYLTLKKQELQLQKKINEEENGGKTGQKNKPLGQLLKSFGRIAMYRAVRRTIQEITQAFMESIDGIARYNSEFRDTMGSMQTSIDKLKISAGVGFYQVLILIAPIIEQISNGIVALANSLSKVSAQMRGAAQYTKINTDYMKKYKSALDGTLLSFDTFTTLGKAGGIDFSQILDTVDTPLDKEKWSDLDVTISGLVSAFQGIWNVLKVIIEGVGKLVKWLSDKNLLTPAVYAFLGILLAIKSPFALLITGIATLIGGWEQMSTTAKVLIPIIAALAAVLTGLAVAKAAAAAGIAAPVMAGITAAAIAAGVALTAGSIIALKAYKDGGIMDASSFKGAGTMYALAGESGAEVVATGSAGTGVLNVDQFADAMVSALVRYGAARDTSNGATIVLDGNKVGQLVASNVGFRNEANRRNANLNWR